MTGAHRALHSVPTGERATWTEHIAPNRPPRHRAQPPSVPSPAAVRALRAIPILGWAFLLLGVVRPFRSRLLRVAFWIDVVLSVGVHAAQIPIARREAAERGIAPGRAAVMTMVFGATWWKTLGEDSR